MSLKPSILLTLTLTPLTYLTSLPFFSPNGAPPLALSTLVPTILAAYTVLVTTSIGALIPTTATCISAAIAATTYLGLATTLTTTTILLPTLIITATIACVTTIHYPDKIPKNATSTIAEILVYSQTILLVLSSPATESLVLTLISFFPANKGANTAVNDAFKLLANHVPYYQALKALAQGATTPATTVAGTTSALIWALTAVLVTAVVLYSSGQGREVYERVRNLITSLVSNRTTHDYTVLSTATDSSRTAQGAQPPLQPPFPRRAIPVPPTATTYNMFDSADLPPRLLQHAKVVYTVCEDLCNFFGFQDASVRNQAEHVLILLSNQRRYAKRGVGGGVQKLHEKMFGNYTQWCESVGVRPSFVKGGGKVTREAAMITDIVLYFCIWGEGANLRHTPECLCFLYHKMHESYERSDAYARQTRSLYPGHFLDAVVSPIFDVYKESLTNGKDHINKKNYDDFNEFFWGSKCLQYMYRTAGSDAESTLEAGLASSTRSSPPLPAVSFGLRASPKSFLEKRSVFRGVLALSRIIEWNVVTFYLLAVVAFSHHLVWGWVYSLQVGSGVFVLMNGMYLSIAILEVWAVYPSIELSGTAVTGHLLSLITKFLVLVYQTMYLMWTFGRQGAGMNFDADAAFWWWQYVWLSSLVVFPYLLGCVLNLVPVASTMMYTNRNDYVQSFLNIVNPLSRLYVGKVVHESLTYSVKYVLFWTSLIAFKLCFSYYFEVSAMVLPTLELTDDYVNYPHRSFYRMAFLLFVRWLPQFTVYCIDTGIWYALWQAVAGTAVGIEENLGDVKDFSDIRKNFTKMPEAFCSKIVAENPNLSHASSSNMLRGMDEVKVVNVTTGPDENSNLLGGFRGDSSDSFHGSLQSVVNSATKRLLDVRIQKWVFFSAAWNEIIDHFREEDIINNKEMNYLKFSKFPRFQQPIYLPVFQTAGVVEQCVSSIEQALVEVTDQGIQRVDASVFKSVLDDHTKTVAVSEVWELGCYCIGVLLGGVHQSDTKAISDVVSLWATQGTLNENLHVEKLRGVLASLGGVVGTLQGGLSRRKPSKGLQVGEKKKGVGRVSDEQRDPSDLSSAGNKFKRSIDHSGMKRASSTNSLSKLHNPASSFNLPAGSTAEGEEDREVVILDALRDQVRDKFRDFAYMLKGMLKGTGAGRDLADRLTFLLSMENGFIWNDAYATTQLDVVSQDSLFKNVLSKVDGLISAHPDDVEPKSKEAKRRLSFFVNSLFMDMPTSPNMHDMMSWSVMTPFYGEDVTYSKADLEKKSSTLGVSVLLYLQTLYKSDWVNFMERLKLKDEDSEKIWHKKYLPEVRKWASMRAQTLSRTVSGMMMNEKALRLLSRLEGHDLETTDDLMCEKFGYVVACQIYGSMKKNQNPKADDIEDLMHRFPHMRVAYIDNVRVNRDGESMFFSVLVKSDGAGGVSEIYRVRLPGNPVIGEGKPENQNHAVIFTRGEFLQTIDMNQEGYFEESLKMRNALQEFDRSVSTDGGDRALDTTILGLREHIFTGSVSSLANYMALQETSFVTLGQRVLNKPLCSRLHYGHPDVFDKLFFMTRGGVSKASKGINLSEDIFAGYNNVVRGGSVSFKEYVQVGKGRDVGAQQIYQFEAKLSQGNAEQSLSRDVYRMCQRLDIFRVFSFYFGGIGFYIGNVITVFTIYLVCYLMLGLALFDCEKIGDRKITPEGTLQMLLGGMGLLNTLPLFATLGVERGWWAAFLEICQVFVTGGPLHFMFHIQTKAHYFAQTILVGGAKYRATGRGFVTQHAPFDENFRFFASSHLYLGLELAAALILMGMYTSAGQYFGRTWSLWLAAVSFLSAPFWFNPLTFEWAVVVKDYEQWRKWMAGRGGGAAKSWDVWYSEENAFYKKLGGSSKLFYVCKALVLLGMGEGVRRSDFLVNDETLNKPWVSVGTVGMVFLLLLLLGKVMQVGGEGKRRGGGWARGGGIIVSLGLVGCVLVVFKEDTNMVRYSMGGYYMMGCVTQLVLMFAGVSYAKWAYRIHDLVVGHVIFSVLFLAAAMQFPNTIQTWLLYHNALSSDVVIEDILKYSRTSQKKSGGEDGGGVEEIGVQVAELRKMLAKQERELVSLRKGERGEGEELMGLNRNESTDAIAALVGGGERGRNLGLGQGGSGVLVSGGKGGRGDEGRKVTSMSNLAVWGEMTGVGDEIGEDEVGGDEGVVDEGGVSGGEVVSCGTVSGGVAGGGGFEFSQPDKLPPR